MVVPLLMPIRLRSTDCFILLAMGSVALHAQPTDALEVEVLRCSAIESPDSRLACFDRTIEPFVATDVTTDGAAEAAAEEPDFGAEQLINDEDADDLMTRLAGPFTGWDGDTVFRLENGQLWQQIDSSYLYSRAESPRVTIRRAAFGSYLLQVEGIGRTVRVRRLE